MTKTSPSPWSSILRSALLVGGGALLAWLVLQDPFGIGTPRGEGAPPRGADAASATWTCGMHPQVLEPEPGSCPICGMDLVRAGSPEEQSAAQATHDTWTCPMHPQVVTDEAGTCPLCKMDLVKAATPPPAAQRIVAYRHPHDPTITSPVPAKDSMGMDFIPVMADEAGGPVVAIDPAVVQRMNVVTATVARADVTRDVRTVGHVDYDQQSVRAVTLRFPGFVEKAHVVAVGEEVRRGQPLFEIFSPEMEQTQRELLAALDYAKRLGGTSDEAAHRRAEQLVDAARERLRNWDLSADQVEDVERTGRARRTVTIRSPSSGVVMEAVYGLAGMRFEAGADVLHLADLSHVWLTVDVFDDQLAWVDVGQPATVEASFLPGRTFEGRVLFVQPAAAEETRTVRVTLDVPNPRRDLRVGMYATVRFHPVVAQGVLTVPKSAVIMTGERDVVVVALGEGRFEPREVTLGAAGDEVVAVSSGLSEGEEVVTSAQFLIDSESHLHEAIQKMRSGRTGR